MPCGFLKSPNIRNLRCTNSSLKRTRRTQIQHLAHFQPRTVTITAVTEIREKFSQNFLILLMENIMYFGKINTKTARLDVNVGRNEPIKNYLNIFYQSRSRIVIFFQYPIRFFNSIDVEAISIRFIIFI